MSLGQEILERSKANGLTLKELSRLASVPYTTLYSFCKRDGNSLDIDYLNRINDVFSNDAKSGSIKIGSAIKQARKSAGLTQQDLADKAGVAVNSIRLYEAGKRTTNVETLEAIASACDTTLIRLLGGNHSPSLPSKQKWRDDAITSIQRLSELKEELSILQEEYDLLEHKVQFYMKQGIITDRDLSKEG